MCGSLEKYIKIINPLKSYKKYREYISEKQKDLQKLQMTISTIPRVSPNPLLFKNMGFVNSALKVTLFCLFKFPSLCLIEFMLLGLRCPPGTLS